MKYRIWQLSRIGFFLGFLIMVLLFGLPELRKVESLQAIVRQLDTFPLWKYLGVNSVQRDESLELELLPETVTTNQQLMVQLNQERARASVYPLLEDTKLATAAAAVLEELVSTDSAQWSTEDMTRVLTTSLKKLGYSYARLNYTSLEGPTSTQQIIQGLQEQDDLAKDLYSIDYLHAAFAHQGQTTFFVLAEPGKQPASAVTRPTQAPRQVIVTPTPVAEIPDDEVIKALNDYRVVHGASSLRVDENLCRYAEKRVKDLIANKGLDGHEGFKKDFAVEKREDLPQPIKDYGYGKIGENLASQFCRNMTTGDSFVAQTGVALIEWCFDSSTAGHKEAQLSREFQDVCVRHGKNMYVITFGGK